ncbi:class I SAM-dependent methyltransferase [Dactylosporangium roseum]|uniref:Class I SAM-dependent methyltransferase n=1 Tax=Dactylosporangium roseum TaxID=47989 RepID=A0ABY5ZCD4_9ACTN|nr:class I SAM-dependent methyltransferase [Dactylosporangium roseum]UWZ39319.1 class I SAM-dependent methyltransferase [Dactylosporangium roseum]
MAEIYQARTPVGHSYGDVEYYTRHLAGIKGKILEMGSGTGRILVRLLEADFDVEGLEHSPDMIAICRANCESRGFAPALHEGNMTSFVNPEAYEAVIIPAGTITNLDGRELTRAALECCWQSLVPGGRFILDLEIPGLLTGPQQPLKLWRSGEDLWTIEIVHSTFNPAKNQMVEYVRYEKWTSGRLMGTELHMFRTQHWVPEEFAALLREVGFVDVRITANYDDDARPGPRDNDWSFHATKPEATTD